MKKYAYCMFYATVLSTCFIAGAAWYVANHPVIDLSLFYTKKKHVGSVLLDCDGNEWARFEYEKRSPVVFSQMPKHLIDAFIATEDWRFFSHSGLSFKGIIRSIWTNILKGRKEQGASTITQQLVKLLFFDQRKTFKRKIQEQWYALLIEGYYSKEQILETYLNTIYFGAGVYGVGAAAETFFGKTVHDLSLHEAALLAGIIRSPSHYNPFVFPRSAQYRRDVVLGNMKRLSFISESEYEEAKKQKVHTLSKDKEILAPHMRETIRVWLERKFGSQRLYAGGLIVKTTLSLALQKKAQDVFNEKVKGLRGSLGGDIDGALVSIDKKTGQIRALVGGYDKRLFHYNRALQGKRQIGSAFKPFVYAAALMSGMSLLDTAVDEPLKVVVDGKLWEPRNYNRKFEGTMTLARALSYSNNIISVKVILDIGPEKVIEYAKKAGLKCSLQPYPSLALGCVDASLLEVVGMFNVFPNHGIYVEPYCVTSVVTRDHELLYEAETRTISVFPEKVADQVGSVLVKNIERKKTNQTEWIDSEAMSKTGTTNDSRNCWFIGATPEITTGVYIGTDDNRPLGKNVFPLQTAYPIWLDFHKKIKTKVSLFAYNTSLQSVRINWKTGAVSQAPLSSDIQDLQYDPMTVHP